LKRFRILGIYRNPIFSNNAIEADRLILQESIAQLQAQFPHPIEVEMIEELETAHLTPSQFDLVLTMAQSDSCLRAIDENLGESLVWNSPAAIRNCYRKTMSQILTGLDLHYAPYRLLRTNEELPAFEAGSAYWLKRSDFHAIADEDVTLAESESEMQAKLKRFRERDVREVIVQKHIVGDIYKFYGVKGKFFRAIKVRDFLKGAATPDLSALEKTAFQAASALGLMVFGGDCVVDATGAFHLIDLNDWPSFRICREPAARAIGALAAEQLASAALGAKRTVAARA
jgi:hypothetical protein